MQSKKRNGFGFASAIAPSFLRTILPYSITLLFSSDLPSDSRYDCLSLDAVGVADVFELFFEQEEVDEVIAFGAVLKRIHPV